MTAPTYDADFFPDFRGQAYTRGIEHRTVRSDPTTAGDIATALAGNNVLSSFSLGWRRLTDAQADAVRAAVEFMGVEGASMFWLEWRLGTATNLVLGTGTGAGSLVFPLFCRLNSDNAMTSGLAVTKNGFPVAYSLSLETGANYSQAVATIAPANNVAGHTYRVSWDSARRRRRVRFRGGFRISENPGASKLWTASAEFIETGLGVTS